MKMTKKLLKTYCESWLTLNDTTRKNTCPYNLLVHESKKCDSFYYEHGCKIIFPELPDEPEKNYLGTFSLNRCPCTMFGCKFVAERVSQFVSGELD